MATDILAGLKLKPRMDPGEVRRIESKAKINQLTKAETESLFVELSRARFRELALERQVEALAKSREALREGLSGGSR